MNTRLQLSGENRPDDKAEGGWFVAISSSPFSVEAGGPLSNRNNSSQSTPRTMPSNVAKS